MIIEPATLSDLPALHALIQSAYRGDSARVGWTHEADLLEGQRTDEQALVDIICDPNQAILAMRDGASLAGCIAITVKPGGLAYIGMVTVDPQRQNGGLGRQLLEAAEAHARDHFGCTRAEMTVIALRSELIAWYERRGYAATGETRPFPDLDPRVGRKRRDDLDFIVLEKSL